MKFQASSTKLKPSFLHQVKIAGIAGRLIASGDTHRKG